MQLSNKKPSQPINHQSVSSGDIPALITEKEAAAMTGLSTKWFQRMRWSGGGPPFLKLAPGRPGAIRYDLTKLRAWLEQREHTSTSSTEDIKQ